MLIPNVLAYEEPVGELVSHPIKPEVVIPLALKEIARCESGNRHYLDNGEVIRGKVNPQDIGKYQINLKYHGAKAKEMGLDLFTEDGNEQYALFLYKISGAQPWKASNHCHKLLQ